MAGTLLYGQSKAEWQAVQRKGLAKMRQDGNIITHVLKLSYYHLDTHLKSCFSFCAIFPKDYVMNKKMLIMLWMAQGYVEPLDEGQSIYDAGEEHFSILLRRCFFQDVETDECGEIMSCKMHDLMHDIAQEVAGDEICDTYAAKSKIDKRARHVFHIEDNSRQTSLPRSKIRTYLQDGYERSQPMYSILRNWKYLRALDLHSSSINEFPCAIGRLLHLRYLDLSYNPLKRLPDDITKLHNLQTLLLRYCDCLQELPSDLGKLAKLRVLDIERCKSLTYMPCGLDKLSGLCIMTWFVAGTTNSTKQKQGVGVLKDIAGLDHLKGKLTINIHSNAKTDDKGGYLKNKEQLHRIELQWLNDDEKNENKAVSDKVIAEKLQPHPNLKSLYVSGYKDVDKPSWAIDDKLQTSLPNLVSLTIEKCKGLEDLPMLGNLRFLKSLYTWNLPNLEYMEKGSSGSYGDEENSGTGLFSSLEYLTLAKLPKLKGWWSGDSYMNDDDDERSNMSISFPRLFSLRIVHCPLLTSMPLCPTVEELTLRGFNERLRIMKMEKIERGRKGQGGDGRVMDMSSCKLRMVNTNDLGYLKSLQLPVAFQSVSSMSIYEDEKVKNLREVEDIFRSCSSSLQTLLISDCRKLRSINGALEHLSALQELCLYIHSDIINDEMTRYGLEEEDEVPWSALQHCLRVLDINYAPKGMRLLTSLQTLTLYNCKFVEIPEWITYLSSLLCFEILNCSRELKQRCRSPDGADWHKIQHIPVFKL